jgi:hypothetical protein
MNTRNACLLLNMGDAGFWGNLNPNILESAARIDDTIISRSQIG